MKPLTQRRTFWAAVASGALSLVAFIPDIAHTMEPILPPHWIPYVKCAALLVLAFGLHTGREATARVEEKVDQQ